MKSLRSFRCLGWPLALVCAAISAGQLIAQPTLVTNTPANMATGVSPTSPAVFTFSQAMDPSATSAEFMDTTTAEYVTTSPAWSAGNTILTCTPVPSWPANKMVVWMVGGANPAGTALGGDNTVGMFTASSSTGTGCDTNASMLSFTISKGWMYEQTSAAAPVMNTNAPYCFLACMSIPCPRNANSVSLQLPPGGIEDMNPTTIAGHLTWTDCTQASVSDFETAYPSGDYTFTIWATASNQSVAVNLPSSLVQPPAPHLANYAAAQSVYACQPFTLTWDPFTGGTAADCISVQIYGGVFSTPAPGGTGLLNGTATSVVIPAGTFQTNSSYSGCVSFYHFLLQTNGDSYVSLAYRSSTTEFGLVTSGAGSLMVTNAGWATVGKVFAFDVPCSPGQSLVAEYCKNLLAGQWHTLLSTNSVTDCVRFCDPGATTNSQLFYRVRTGP